MKVTEKPTKPRSAKIQSEESAIGLEEQISRRAYELYERRGREHGHEAEDWLQAEAELAQERAMSAARVAVKKTRRPPVGGTAKKKVKRVKNMASPAQTKTQSE